MTRALEDILRELPREPKGSTILDKRHPAYKEAQDVMASIFGYPDPTSVNLSHGQVSPKMSSGPAFFREGIDDPFEIYMFRTVQQQIGMGGPAKWMIGGGGFIDSHPIENPAGGFMFESPAMNATRTCKFRLGFDLRLPPNATWFPITKEPYDVTNETFVHGIIWKVPVYLNRKAAAAFDKAVEAKEVVGRWMGVQEFDELVASGDHTMDPSEVDFAHGCMVHNTYQMYHQQP